MTPERFQRLESLYDVVAEMDPQERTRYIQQECAADEEMQRELLAAFADDSHSVLTNAVQQAALSMAQKAQWPGAGDTNTMAAPGGLPPTRPLASPVAVSSLEGHRVGHYQVLRVLGHGGMGDVYLAQRADNAFHKLVALKVIRAEVSSAEVVRRFRQEREILAALDHPNISRLLDGGTTSEGWPYFVMEYVEGCPIDRYSDEHKLTITGRLRLFQGVCAAVEYAHQHLIVHRDLKPSNILVTRDGTVKLLDFGIAKLLRTQGEETVHQTRAGTHLMTPEYASPEQVKGETITTQSDVYSLGVVLYELLTGHRPYRLASAALHEVARVIADVEPTRPSDIVITSPPRSGSDEIQATPETVSAAREGDANRLSKRLRGDLDAILLMALRKDPATRYRSVESFAEDLQRHLEGRPIRAREGTPWEKLVRFWWLNRGGFTIGSVMVVMFLSGMAAVVWQTRRDIQAATRDSGIEPFPIPLWLFAWGVATGAQLATVYFTRVLMPQRLIAKRFGAVVGGLVWGLAMLGRWRIGRNLGWWHSRIAGYPDPLWLFKPLSFGVCGAIGIALVLVFFMIGLRFGRKGQAVGLVLIGLVLPLLERIWFGTFIPALEFAPGIAPALGSAGILISAGMIAILLMALIGGLSAAASSK